mmetsp:Transcript_289/g.367  ORF Transcript_289/g.367 Transcript_289/m.367 type:complete len:283 (+) Transcript_289:127-975(+)
MSASTATTPQKLTPEQKEAVEVFVSTLPHWRDYYVDQLPVTVFENNARFFTPAPLKKEFFPREPHWTWNRSNGTIVIDLYQQFRIRLAKFNSRRRKTAVQQQPSYKIWSYSVTVLQTNEEFSFIWCTKGKTRSHRDTTQKTEPQVPQKPKVEPQQVDKQEKPVPSEPKPISISSSTPSSQPTFTTGYSAPYQQPQQYSFAHHSAPQMQQNYSNAVQLQNQFSNLPPLSSYQQNYVPQVQQTVGYQEDTPTDSSSSSDISLADFKFLREFADPDIACQFGWDS